MKDYCVTITKTETLHFGRLKDAERKMKQLCKEYDGNKDVEIWGIENADYSYKYINGKLCRGFAGPENMFWIMKKI